jgi:23S rRNA (guanosine2251-2'-O)-methyltransferase
MDASNRTDLPVPLKLNPRNMPFDLPKPDRAPRRDREQSNRPGGKKNHYSGPKRPPKGSYIMGWHPVQEALEAGKEFQRVMIQRDEKGERTSALLAQLKQLNIPVQRVPKEKLHRVTVKNHQGIIAFLSPISYQPLDELVTRTFEAGETPLFVALDGVTDVRNIGAIARSAECFGATALIIPSFGVAPIQEDAIKSSSGALLRLPVARVPNLSRALEELSQSGIAAVALSEKAEKTIHTHREEGPICLVLGDEETGISEAVDRKCALRLRLPMHGKTGSLNVSVAAGVALSHLTLWKDAE